MFHLRWAIVGTEQEPAKEGKVRKASDHQEAVKNPELLLRVPFEEPTRTWRRRSRKDMKFRFVEVLLWAHVTQVDEFCVEESKAENPISELLDHTWRLAFRTKSAVDPNV